MQERNAVDRMTSQDGIPLRMQWLVPVFHFPFGFHSFRYMIFISITGIAGKCTTPSFEALTIIMAQVVNVNFRMDAELKKSMEQACSELGMSMTTAFTIFAKKVSREKRIPFDVCVDPFYSEQNMRDLEKITRDVTQGKAHYAEHELLEGDE